MEKIGEAIIAKVKVDAQNIVREAEEKAKEEIEKAKRQREIRFDEDRAKMLRDAEEEAARILAQASITARQELSSAKAEIIAKITDGARNELSRISSDEGYFLNLVRDAMKGLDADKCRIYVSPKDMSSAKRYIETDKELAGKIVEVREANCLGGVIVDDVDGKFRIDNTYETRLDMLLPKLLPQLSKELFESP